VFLGSVEFIEGKARRGLDVDAGTVSVGMQEAKSMMSEPDLV